MKLSGGAFCEKGTAVVYIGISLDGYIATKDDSLDWLLHTQGSGDNGFGAFYDTVDAIIMGRRTYDWIMNEENGRFPYEGKECYVYTHSPLPDTDRLLFTAQPLAQLIETLKNKGKRIWIVGGSQLIHQVRQQNLADEYIISIAPVILGDGIPLFCKGIGEELIFEQSAAFGQFIELRYRKA